MMNTFKAIGKKRTITLKTAGLKKVVVKRPARAVAEKAASEEYQRKYEKAYRLYDEAEQNALKAMRATVERISAEEQRLTQSSHPTC